MSGGPPRVARLRRMLFEAWGPTDDPVIVARAPGRVNLIGEHTDYNEGLVLPAAIDLDTCIAFHPRTDRRVELHSLAFGETRAFDLNEIKKARVPGSTPTTWIDYVAGTAWALAGAGVELRGLRGIVESRVPSGAGLASSAALELASALALIDQQSPMPEPLRLAMLAKRAEEEFVGVRCGVMDQLSAALGRAGHALLIDCRTLDAEPVLIPPGLSLVVCDSGVPRRLGDSGYNQRRAECEEGVRLLRERLPWVNSLRDLDPDTFEQWRPLLPQVIAMRCEHVIRETARVQEAVRALRGGDLQQVGVLFRESHASLRDVYQVSSPELDTLVDVASGVSGVVGARLTGAGFGGCTVNLVRTEAVDEFEDAVLSGYAERAGHAGGFRTRPTPTVHVVDTADGAGFITA